MWKPEKYHNPTSFEKWRRKSEYETYVSPGFIGLLLEEQMTAASEFLREYEAHPRKELFVLLGGKVFTKFDEYPEGRVLTFFLPEEW